ncbi:MAG: endonuclease/exonuclease/phosphatase family protein [Roseiflexaceae bacterium]
MPTNFSVMTWNVENLFPAGHDPGSETPEIFEQKLQNIARIILDEIQPDVVAVQEVGGLGPFHVLQQHLNGRYPHARLSAHPDLRGIRVGFLSRFPLEEVDDLFAIPAGALRGMVDTQGQPIAHMGRGALKITVQPAPGWRINLVTAHLKSKLITYPPDPQRPHVVRRSPRDEDERACEAGAAVVKRTVEAVALRVFANTLVTQNQQPLIVLGDFNDVPDAATTQILRGTEDLSLARPDKGDDTRLYNLAAEIPAERRFSRIYNKQKELIDHILVSYELARLPHQVDSRTQDVESIDNQLGPRRRAVFPDHAPVFARFELA